MTTYYKSLNERGWSRDSVAAEWPLPRGTRPGKWMPEVTGELWPHECGYHVYTAEQLLSWLGPRVWRCEVRGEVITCADTTVARQARLVSATGWNDSVARLFACDCAARVTRALQDDASRRAIVTARAFAFGMATEDDLKVAGDATRVLAWQAARQDTLAAARLAAYSATYAAGWEVAEGTSHAAAWAAAAGAAAAATAAEVRWQARRLARYLDGKVDLAALRLRAERDWNKLQA